MPNDLHDAELQAAYDDYLDACIDKGEEPVLFEDFIARQLSLKTTLPAPVANEDDKIPF